MNSDKGHSAGGSATLEIGGCTVTPSQNLLERDGLSVSIPPRTMDVLIYLAAHAGEVVSGEELIDAVWRGRLVNDAQVYKSMSQLRRVFDELRGDVQAIQTIPKRGYRLVASVSPAESSARVSPPGPAGMSQRRALGLVIGGVLVLAVLVVGGRSMEAERRPPGEVTPQLVSESPTTIVEEPRRELFANSLAVLPFENLSPNPDDAYFAAGIHEEILNHLTKIKDLAVISRSTVLPYARAEQPISEIAAELRVGKVLVGSVRYADDRVRVSIQLIDAGRGSQLWSAIYERDFEDIFAIQTDIAARVAAALEAQLSLAERRPIEERLTSSPEAYALYLRAGTTDLSPGLPASLRHLYLDRAIALDPDFAHAYARKANAYTLALVDNFASGAADFTDLAELDSLARQNAEKALALDPSVGLAYLALGRLYQYRWRWAEAEQAYERALESNPGDLDALRLYSQFNSHAGNHAKAIRLAQRAVELAPAEPGLHFRLGTVFLHAGDHDAAIAASREAIELDPMYTIAHVYLAIMEGIRGHIDEALTELRVAEWCLDEDPLVHLAALTAYGYSRIGRHEDVARIAQEFQKMAVGERIGAGSGIFIALALGDEDKALEWLQSAIEEIENLQPDASYHNLMLVKANAFADAVLDEPPFRAARDRIQVRREAR